MIKDILENNSILVVPNEIKLDILKEISNFKEIYNIKIMSLDELIECMTYKVDERALYYLMKNYKLNYAVCKMYLKNIKYVDSLKNYKSFKLSYLKKIKIDLESNNLLIKDHNFNNLIKDKKIIIYGYDYINNYDMSILNSIKNKKIISKKFNNFDHEIYEFNNINDEIVFVAENICKLINNNISINNIKLTGISKEYINPLRRIFKLFNIPVNINESSSIISSYIVNRFLNLIKENSGEESISILKKEYNFNNDDNNYIYESLIKILNKYNFIKEKEILIEIIENELINVKEPCQTLKNAVNIINLENNNIKDTDYIFLLGLNSGNIPFTYKDEEYITDDIKNEIIKESVPYLNKISKENAIKKIKNIKNLFISYKLKTDFDSFLPSPIIEELRYPINSNYKNSYQYSNLYNQIILASKIDNLIKYNTHDEILSTLYNSYQDIPYLNFNNCFKGIDSKLLQEKLQDGISLSYSSIDNLNRCSFRYFLGNILKLNKYEETFLQKIGTMFHDILQVAFSNNFEFDKYFLEYKKNIEFTKKEEFFLKKLKEELRFVINTIKKQNSFSSLDNALYENKITINDKFNDKLSFVGIVDKILYKKENNETYIVIIDYKTGIPHTNLNNTIYGIDMQLPVYLYLVKNGLFKDAKIIGFYLQRIIHNEINKDPSKNLEKLKTDNLKLLGYSTDNEELLKMFDFTFKDSEVIKSLKSSKNGFYKYSKIINEKDIDKLVDIVEKNINLGFKKILDADFSINPKRIGKKNVGCEYCPFSDICYVKEENIISLDEYKDLEFLKEE